MIKLRFRLCSFCWLVALTAACAEKQATRVTDESPQNATSVSSLVDEAAPIPESTFTASLTPGKFILPAKKGWWNWGMAPIYDDQGKLHIFNSAIPYKGESGMGYWKFKSEINHYVADSIEGPYQLVKTLFASDKLTYHNPQISKVGDTYVLVFLWKSVAKGSKQSIGMATAKSLNGPWTENPNNPIIRPTENTHNAAHASNPTFVVDREGKYRIYYKSMYKGSKYREMSVAIADKIDGPYIEHPQNPIISFKDIERDIEDPYAFFYNDSYYMIVEDRMNVAGALAGDFSPVKSGGYRPGLLFKSEDGINWGRPELSYKTDAEYFGVKLSRSERPHILWKDGEPEYLFLANHGSHEAGFYLKINDWQPN